MKILKWMVVLAIILIGGYFLVQQAGLRESGEPSDMGAYAYVCENGMGFTMTPSEDVRSLTLEAGSQGMFTGMVSVAQDESTMGARFVGTTTEGSPITFVGAGEEVQIMVGSTTTICNPVPSTESPPWNWGDAGEGVGSAAPDTKNMTFHLSGESVMLVNGYAETKTTMGAASKSIVRYFGNEAVGDLNADGRADVVFLVTQETGGSGTFFYLVGAIQGQDGGYVGTNAVLIGDRIAPQTTEFRDGLVIVNYADRAPGEPFSARPSVGKSLYLKYTPESNDFGEVVQNFEGESR